MSAFVDPSLPTNAPPGSPEKVEILCLRREQHLPLFLPGDAEGVRHLAEVSRGPTPQSTRFLREHRLLEALAAARRSLTAKELADAARIPLRRIHQTLALLREANVVERAKRHRWKLTPVQA